VACERFEVEATLATVRAEAVELHATRGNLDLRANDSVIVVGEQVRLNCDQPDELPDWMLRELAARIRACLMLFLR